MTSISPDYQSRTIALNGNRILIDGTARTLLCASLFPFRVPREQWRERLKAVKRLGYHMLDVYAPWNFHERERGVYNFEGQHDLEEFLKEAAEEGLYSLVRPGPYICSEYDGGALPAWVASDTSLRIRQNDPKFLELVGQWYDHVIPIIARQQYTRGGSVILVQADNELDFFACSDPAGYIGTLRAMMQARGIEVPIIACAGQGDLKGAYGYTPGVAPAYNIYPNDNSVDIDEHTRYHRRVLDNLETPFIVTETNRWHRTIKREIGSGVRLAGPYLQASGWDFDFDTSTTNWGTPTSPAAFATHCYDFGGVIDPIGQERADAAQARQLSRIIAALGEALATSTLASEPEIITAAHRLGISDALNLKRASLGMLHLGERGCAENCAHATSSSHACAYTGAGTLYTVTNLSDEPLTVRLNDSQGIVPAGECVMFVENLHDAHFSVLSSNCEITARTNTHLEFSAVTGSEPFVDLALSAQLTSAQGIEVERIPVHSSEAREAEADNAEQHIRLHGTGHVEFAVEDGTTVVVDILSVAGQAAREQEITSSDDAPAPLTEVTEAAVLSEQEVIPSAQLWVSRATMNHAQQVEKWGITRGLSRYTHVSRGENLEGVSELILNGANDIFSIAVTSGRSSDAITPDATTNWTANTGQAVRVTLPQQLNDGDTVSICTQTWGHANFDDTRLPGLQLTGGRGLGGVMAVRTQVSLSDGWLLHNPAPQFATGPAACAAQGPAANSATNPAANSTANLTAQQQAGLVIDQRFSPRSGLASRSSTVWPRDVVYTHTLTAADLAGLNHPVQAALEISGMHARAEVHINNRAIGTMTPLKPILVLGEIHLGDELEVSVHQSWGEPLGNAVTLLVGTELTGWQLDYQPLEQLKACARACLAQPITQLTSLPVEVSAEEPQWLRIPRETVKKFSRFHNTLIRFQGENLQITAFTKEYCLGRTVLGGIEKARFSGGDPLLLIVPEGEGDVLLRLEATQSAGGTLDAFLMGGELDQHSKQ